MNLAELLQPYREERPHAAIALVGKPEQCRIAAAWETYPIEWREPQGDVPTDDRKRWEWLWSGIHMDWQDFARHAGVNHMTCEARFVPLVAARLLFPDGTISTVARTAIATEVLRSSGRRKK